MYGELRIFSGRAHPQLAEEISDYLSVPLGKVDCYNFSDGEIFVQLKENVRGADTFVIQPTCPPVNDNLVELLIMLDAVKRSSASRITAVVPYYGYARQDKKDAPRVPITAKLVADLISQAGAERVLTMDVMLEAIRALDVPNLVIVSPDAGGVERARAIAKRLEAGLAIVDKRRVRPNEAAVMHIIGDVAERNVLILDDIIDTAGTLTQTVAALRAKGAQRVLAAGVHGILSGPALDRINEAPIDRVLVTNTTPLDDKLALCPKLEPLSVAPLLGEAILRIHQNSTVSKLFV
jgi:ribose-phosphate pyrophosphokinase